MNVYCDSTAFNDVPVIPSGMRLIKEQPVVAPFTVVERVARDTAGEYGDRTQRGVLSP